MTSFWFIFIQKFPAQEIKKPGCHARKRDDGRIKVELSTVQELFPCSTQKIIQHVTFGSAIFDIWQFRF